ncbi:hypothetical protein Tco_0204819 [Tanacetum coccineum]
MVFAYGPLKNSFQATIGYLNLLTCLWVIRGGDTTALWKRRCIAHKLKRDEFPDLGANQDCASVNTLNVGEFSSDGSAVVTSKLYESGFFLDTQRS